MLKRKLIILAILVGFMALLGAPAPAEAYSFSCPTFYCNTNWGSYAGCEMECCRLVGRSENYCGYECSIVNRCWPY